MVSNAWYFNELRRRADEEQARKERAHNRRPSVRARKLARQAFDYARAYETPRQRQARQITAVGNAFSGVLRAAIGDVNREP